MQKITPEDGQSADLIHENIEQLKQLFPEAFNENGVDFDVLRQLLGDAGVLDEGEEKYGLNWHGKKKARQIALTPSMGTLLPCPEESVDWDTTQNIFIEGDNLEVLKLLQKSYANKVKLIYIDPPYNTDGDFVYADNYRDGLETYLSYTGQKGEEGLKFTSNTETSGRKHTNWLNMMYPRLTLSKNLLKHNGIIAVSIDDHEVAQLKNVMTEIFGGENFLNCISVKMSEASGVKMTHAESKLPKLKEYVLLFRKSESAKINSVTIRAEKWNEEYKHFLDDISENEVSHLKKLLEKIQCDKDDVALADQLLSSAKIISCSEAFEKYSTDEDFERWRWNNSWRIIQAVGSASVKKIALTAGKERVQTIQAVQSPKGLLYLYKTDFNTDTKAPRIQIIFADMNIEQKLGDFWQDIRTTGAIGQEGGIIFPNGKKPQMLLKRLVKLFTDKDTQDYVLDFFAGSGSTAQAVLDQNLHDGGNRKFILAQLQEKINPKNELSDLGFKVITEVTKKRLSNVIEKNKTGGFKVFKLAQSNIRAWNPDRAYLEKTLLSHQDHLIEGRTEQDLLYELLLKRGVDLAVAIEQREVVGKTLYSIGAGVLFACLDSTIADTEVESIAQAILSWRQELDPATESHVFFRDSAFQNDVAKTNMVAILEQNGINHVRSL